jgi:hypothetical protein
MEAVYVFETLVSTTYESTLRETPEQHHRDTDVVLQFTFVATICHIAILL